MVKPGDSLPRLILQALQRMQTRLQDGDILVLAQKIVSKAEGRLVNLATVRPSPRALELGIQIDKDPRLLELVLRESREVLLTRPGTIIVEHRLGFICASAGVDRPVEAAQERGLAGLRRADDAEDLVALDLEADAPQGFLVAVAHPQIAHGDLSGRSPLLFCHHFLRDRR